MLVSNRVRCVFHGGRSVVSWFSVSQNWNKPHQNITHTSKNQGITNSYPSSWLRQGIVKYQRKCYAHQQHHQASENHLPTPSPPKRRKLSPSVHICSVYKKPKSSKVVRPRQRVVNKQKRVAILFPLVLTASTTKRAARIVSQPMVVQFVSVHVDSVVFTEATNLSD